MWVMACLGERRIPNRENTHTYFVGKEKYHFTTDPCLTGWDLTKQLNVLLIQHNQSSWIKTRKTEGQPYTHVSPYKFKYYLPSIVDKLKIKILIRWDDN